jgi:flagellar FliJ protein
MRALDTLIRMRHDALLARRRALIELEAAHATLARELAALEAALDDEQRTAARTFEALYAYPGFAERTLGERARLEQDMRLLDARITQAREDLSVAFGELKKFEIARDQRAMRERRARARAEQKTLDELALTRFRHGRDDPTQSRR